MATGFFVVLLALVLGDRAPAAVLVVYGVASLVSFAAYGIDKSAARHERRRVPEVRLHAMDLAGGWPGGLVGRHGFRHKTLKQPFRGLFWVTVLANCCGLAAVVALLG